MTSSAVLKEACEGHPLCVISVLPHILDCQADCRNEYISILLKVGERFKKNQWAWVWAEAMQQHQLEDSLGIGGFGYPVSFFFCLVYFVNMHSSLQNEHYKLKIPIITVFLFKQ